MRKTIALVVVGLAALAVTAAAPAGNGTPINEGSANALSLAVYGDAP
jgi:Calcineurin-like phosphoesterase